MSTATLPDIQDPWQQIPATWETFQDLLCARGDRSCPKYMFCDGRLTIVSPGTLHEKLKTRVGGFIEDLCVAFEIDMMAFGSTTYLDEGSKRSGSEPDESYYFTNLDQVRDNDRIAMGVDPAPDLMVEVVATHPLGDTVEVYRRFGVRELWICKRSQVTFLVLGSDGRFAESTTSACLPFLSATELSEWAYRQDLLSDTRLRSLFRAWVAEVLAPRIAEKH